MGRLENSNFPGAKGSGSSIFGQLLKQKPTMPAYWPNGKIGPDIERGENPAALATNMTGFTDNKHYVLNTNLKLDIKIPWIDGLSFTGSVAYDKGIHHNRNFTTPWSLYDWDGSTFDDDGNPVLVKSVRSEKTDPSLTESMEDNQDYLANATLDYKKTIDEHNFGILAGIETRGAKGSLFDAFRRHFVSTALPELSEGGEKDINNSGSASHSARLNYFGRINYNYMEKYLLEFVWRVDGSYIFPEKGRFGFFPGVSAGWRISEEPFWESSSLSTISNDVKIRASYGLTGNDRIDPWQYLTTYGLIDPGYIFNLTEEKNALAENRIPNPHVTWEVAKQFDVGIDASFFDDKLAFTFDYFDYRRSDILWERNASVPTSTGLTLPKENIGKVKNTGFDFNIAYNGNVGELGYGISVNGGYAKNEILFWDEQPGAPSYQKFEGHPMPSDPNSPNDDLYYQAIGIFKDQAEVDKTPHWEGARPGDVIFKDVNGDGVIDADDRVRSDKSDVPTFNAGLGINLNYKRFDLSLLFKTATGAVRYLRLETAGNFGNYLLSDFVGRWTPDHHDASRPRMFDRDEQYYRSERNTYLLHNTDYLRLRNIELGYRLPVSLLDRIGLQELRVYVKGYNLFTYSPDFKDFDPTDNNQGGSNYPPQRILSAGLTVSF